MRLKSGLASALIRLAVAIGFIASAATLLPAVTEWFEHTIAALFMQ